MEYCQKAVKDLIPYINNARTHSDEQVTQIASSIREFGFINPIIIDDKNNVIAGHGRLLASKKLGLKEVPTVLVDHLTDTQRKAYVLADNQLALNAGWDDELLKIELAQLDDVGFDLELLGFDLDALEGLGVEELELEEQEVPEPAEDPISKLGDLWTLGNHRLMCGDSTSVDDVEELMDGTYPDLVHTDPPYGMNAVTKSGVLSKNYKTDIIGDDNPDIAKDAFQLIIGLYPEAKQIWWGANYYCSVLPDSECWLVWDKNNGQSDQTDCELAWANFRSVVRKFTQASEKTNRVHPTQKPVSLMEWIIKRFKLSSNTIADYFGGSGSTLIACESLNRDARIMELDPKYCDVIIKRWQNLTGNDAVLESTGQTYNSLEV